MKRLIRIGTRGSELALWQANHVKSQLESIGLESELKIIKTQGDIIQHLSLDKLEGKGFFTKEIEHALLENEIDLAVHSHKDLETSPPDGLVIAAVSKRADASEYLIIRKECVNENELWHLKKNAVVGTSSARRKAQLLHRRPDIIIKDIRGNVPTRIQKLSDGHFDAILLAKAGVDRLGLNVSMFHTEIIPPKEFVPAPAQGVLALQCRANDESLIHQLKKLNDEEVARCIYIERTVLNKLQGGCHLPLGVYAELIEETYQVYVAIAKEWNAPLKKFNLVGKNEIILIDDIMREICR